MKQAWLYQLTAIRAIMNAGVKYADAKAHPWETWGKKIILMVA